MWGNGGCLQWQISALSCGASTNNWTLTAGIPASSASMSIPYTGWNGGSYPSQIISSAWVTGLTASLSAGTLANGAGSATYNITWTPATSWTASFNLILWGQSCTVSQTVSSPPVISCTPWMNDVTITFETDTYGTDNFWSLVNSGATCWTSEIANGWNLTLDCSSGWASIFTGTEYPSNTSIVEWPYSLSELSTYDLHVIDTYGDGIGTSPAVRITQNWVETDSFNVTGNGWVFSFTVDACIQ